ncbi:ammonia channel protein, partial [Gluconacetobacter azotocaptans]|nr:ammonia channel protein [Gluconacetobacter azotocaptans]
MTATRPHTPARLLPRALPGLAAAPLLMAATPALAADPAIDTGDTAWMLVSTALVLMMTIPGLALFY